jgi:hypothetical protein
LLLVFLEEGSDGCIARYGTGNSMAREVGQIIALGTDLIIGFQQPNFHESWLYGEDLQSPRSIDELSRLRLVL